MDTGVGSRVCEAGIRGNGRCRVHLEKGKGRIRGKGTPNGAGGRRDQNGRYGLACEAFFWVGGGSSCSRVLLVNVFLFVKLSRRLQSTYGVLDVETLNNMLSSLRRLSRSTALGK